MADQPPKIPIGRTKEPTDKEPKDPTDIGDDQYAGWNRGENFQPRNAGAVSDNMDRAAARVAQDINRRSGAAENPGPSQDTSWEARVERGEEWEEQQDKDPARNHDINEDVYKREAPANDPNEAPARGPRGK
jgi:hypothetical protein